MTVKGNFYYVYGNDSMLIEKKWLPDLERKFSNAQFLRYDTTIDLIDINRLTSVYYSNDLFNDGKVILIRNADTKQIDMVLSLAEALTSHPVEGKKP